MTETAPDPQTEAPATAAQAVMASGQVASMPAQPEVSVIIPLYNGAETITQVLEALYRSDSKDFEVIVINDCSTDNSLEILAGLAKKYPFRLIDFPENQGVSKARNAGAAAARGEIILFIDADCIVLPDTIKQAVKALRKGDSICIGGTYTREPWDNDFFSTFQSLYIHYVETKVAHPDYIATHCMAIWKKTYDEFGGFREDYFIGHAASVEDVELSHRLIRAGYQLSRPSEIQVQHIFRFGLKKSVKNAVKKSKYWTMYSLHNRDVTKDSGAASYELKVNVGTQVVNLVLVVITVVTGSWYPLVGVAFLYGINTAVSFSLFRLIKAERGLGFLLKAMGYFQFVYPYVVALGSFMGILKYLWEVKLTRRYQ